MGPQYRRFWLGPFWVQCIVELAGGLPIDNIGKRGKVSKCEKSLKRQQEPACDKTLQQFLATTGIDRSVS